MKRALPYILAALLLAVIAYAQMPPRPGQPAGPPVVAPMAPVMIHAGSDLYILRGDQLLRVAPDSLSVIAQTILPRPEVPKPPAK